ncbi:MDR family MFS transporter [Streptomyces sp. ACA25]|uniref:MDR family MFS transporter n=1 Tax=Streptomyces sp. ACA25 TaxID=3022596 RepID=UPI002307BA4B|nr:MDR family MFS transporter [Streptomyces sp. ACA25]MDB1090198.1 MDR family MFS transporter [Streptomyces sp. ACA25]
MATSHRSAVQGGGEPGTVTGPATPMTHRQIMKALTGLLLGMFVAVLSSTIVTNALPQIISELGGGQTAYTWVITSTLLTMTVSTPLWGKLADLFSKKLLVQLALVIFVLASAGAGLAPDAGTLIAFRAVQGLGMGGLAALAQVVIAAMIAPRERGRYSGYLGSVFAVATVGGPLLGGIITDTPWLGWRWCFYVGVPFAVVALIVLQKTLDLPVVKRRVRIDWTGAFFIAAAASLLLIWVSLAGSVFDWLSWTSVLLIGGALLSALVFLVVESRAAEPVMPLRLFRNRTILFTSLASLFVGVGMFSSTVFLSQYFQLAHYKSPTMSGVLTIPLVTAMFVAMTGSGILITRTGRWKIWLLSGGALITGGLGMLGMLRSDTPYWYTALGMTALGLGLGMLMQNLVLAAQNQAEDGDLGVTSSVVTFFRSLGGAIGVSVLGAALGHRIAAYSREGMAALGVPANSGGGDAIPDLSTLPAPVRAVVENAYGHGIGDIYLYAAPFALLALVMIICVKEVPLRTALPPVRAHAAESVPGPGPREEKAVSGTAAGR